MIVSYDIDKSKIEMNWGIFDLFGVVSYNNNAI